MVQPVSFTLPAFGSIVPGQGGRLAGIMRGATVDDVEQPPYALLISANASHEKLLRWKKNQHVKVAGAMRFSDGLANTEDMLAAGPCDSALHVRQQIDGHHDWYLPSAGEILTAATNVPELFGMPGAFYWTSTGWSDSEALTCAIDVNRVLANSNSAAQFYVRPFRRISLDLLGSQDKKLAASQEKTSNIRPISIVLPRFAGHVAGQGGHFAAILRGSIVNGIEQAPYALLISDADRLSFKAWGSPGKIQGADSYTDGLANTKAMLTANSPAALYVDDAWIEYHQDWYLPSRGEIAAAAANVPEMLSEGEWYWSSTQQGADKACIYDCTHVQHHTADKMDRGYVKPVRRIPLDLLKA